MATMNIHEAKTHFSKLLRRVAAGEEILIARAGRPVARLVPVRDASLQRELGGYVGKVNWDGDFDAPLPREVLDSFDGSGE